VNPSVLMMAAALLASAAALHVPSTKAAALHRPSRAAVMALSFDEAKGKWGLQRNRQTAVVEIMPKVFGWDATQLTTVIERNGPGLGIVLEEIGTDGEVGCVLVDSCVEGGNAAAASKPILPGDTIVAVANVGGPATSVEAFTYDATVEVLGSLDPERAVKLTLRRLVRLPRCEVTLQFPSEEGRDDESLTLLPGMPLRRSMLEKGIKLNDALARRFDAGWGTGDCGGEGTCCTCALAVATGGDALNSQSTQERQMLAKHPDWRLACKASIGPIEEDTQLVLRVAPRREAEVAAGDNGIDGTTGERP